jgi:starch-binding outer membrane protein, SusD/RagB family
MNLISMKLKYIKLSLAALSLGTMLFATSCRELLEVDPRQSIDANTALTTVPALNAAVISVYDRLQSVGMYGRDLIAMPEALADNGRATNNSGRLVAQFQNQINAHMSNWQIGYFAINQCNLILEAAPNVAGITEAQRNKAEGEIHFLRALLYFDLMRVYAYDPTAIVEASNRGGVPLVLKGVLEVAQTTNPARASINEVYDQIYADLNAALEKLPATGGAPHFASRAAAQALFSRVSLYRGDYAKTVEMATAGITTATAKLASGANYVAGWRTSVNPESIFELIYLVPENIGVNESLHTTYSTLRDLNSTVTAGWGDVVPTADFLAQFEPGDIIRALYQEGTNGRGTRNVETTKFLGKNGAVNLDNVPLIRASELHLNRAEANARLGNLVPALTELNQLRARAGLPASVAVTQDEIIAAIARERRIELAFEGHRWFDLKRTGRDIVKLPLTVPHTDRRILAPLPIREVDSNPNLVQNPGY